MIRFAIRKNTLPYIYQWAIIDLTTGNKVGEYKTEHHAQEAWNDFERYGLPDIAPLDSKNTEQPLNTRNAANKRMKQPEGDPLPKRQPSRSNKRPVELD